MNPTSLLGLKFAGRFRLVRYIGPGYFSHVFEAVDEQTEHAVALKILRPDADENARTEFEIEARLLRLLSSASGVVDLFDSAEHVHSVILAGTETAFDLTFRFHVLELADGCLAELLVDLDALAWEARLDLYRDVVKGAHQSWLNGVFNRDYKSENVLLFAVGRHAEAKVGDYGRGRHEDDEARLSLQEYEYGRGDRRFAPPELLYRLADPGAVGWQQVELYLLGSVMFEIATGVGITSLVIPNPLKVIQTTANLREDERRIAFEGALPRLRVGYEQAFVLFEALIPPSIRYEGSRLLRSLCDPDPSRRPVNRRSTSADSGLHWLLHRVDIMRLNLVQADKERRKLEAKKAITRRRRETR